MEQLREVCQPRVSPLRLRSIGTTESCGMAGLGADSRVAPRAGPVEHLDQIVAPHPVRVRASPSAKGGGREGSGAEGGPDWGRGDHHHRSCMLGPGVRLHFGAVGSPYTSISTAPVLPPVESLTSKRSRLAVNAVSK